jgi:hypothetical protein
VTAAIDWKPRAARCRSKKLPGVELDQIQPQFDGILAPMVAAQWKGRGVTIYRRIRSSGGVLSRRERNVS